MDFHAGQWPKAWLASCGTLFPVDEGVVPAQETQGFGPPAAKPWPEPHQDLWEELKRRAKGKKFRNKDEAWEFYRTEWEKIPEETLKKLVDSMPRRLAEVIHSKGYPTKY